MSDELSIPNDQGNAAEATPTSRPDGLPENFNSVADLAKSYSELRAKMDGKVGATPAAPQNPTGSVADILDEATSQVLANGEVSEELYAALESKGMPRGTVDEVLGARRKTADNFTESLIDAAGGKAEWTKVQAWGATALSETERKGINEAIQSGDITRAMFAVEALRSRFEKATKGPRGDLIVPDGSAAGAAGAYGSKAEIQKDMLDPRYRSDAAFREVVQQRLIKTPDSITH